MGQKMLSLIRPLLEPEKARFHSLPRPPPPCISGFAIDFSDYTLPKVLFTNLTSDNLIGSLINKELLEIYVAE